MDNFKLISNDNTSYIEIFKVNYNIEVGYHPSVSFNLKIKTSIVDYTGSSFWFNKSDIDISILVLAQLEAMQDVILNFNAFSEFSSKIKKIDNVGHFCVEFKLEDPVNGIIFSSIYTIDHSVLVAFKTFLIEVQKGFSMTILSRV